MNGRVSFSKPPPDASEANATSTTATLPFTSLGFGSLRGVAKHSSQRIQISITSPAFVAKLPSPRADEPCIVHDEMAHNVLVFESDAAFAAEVRSELTKLDCQVDV